MDLKPLQKDRLYVVVALMPEALETLPPGSIHIALECVASPGMTALDAAMDAIEHVGVAMRKGVALAKEDARNDTADHATGPAAAEAAEDGRAAEAQAEG